MARIPENSSAIGVGAGRAWSRNAGWLLLFCVLASACSSVESAPIGGTGGALAPTGTGGAFGGAGGQDASNTVCLDGSDGCVSSCTQEPFTWALPFCDAKGSFQCPGGFVPLSTCPAGACAQVNILCCDETTGAVEPPACKPDGLRDVCPAGSHSSPSTRCIPTDLGVSNCTDLIGQPCASLGQQCWSGSGCLCGPGDGGLTWSCEIFIP